MPKPDKPRFLLRSSPLVAGGKARLMSNKKVKPSRAKPREVSGDEVHGYTDQQHKALEDAEALTEDDYQRHVLGRKETAAQQQAAIEAARLDQTRRLLSVEERMTECHAEARRRCIDVSSDVRLLRMMLANGKRARHVESRLGAMERKVYREAA